MRTGSCGSGPPSKVTGSEVRRRWYIIYGYKWLLYVTTALS
jgi:hypothetical protein